MVHAAARQIVPQNIRVVELVVRELVKRRIGIGHPFFVRRQDEGPFPHAHLRP